MADHHRIRRCYDRGVILGIVAESRGVVVIAAVEAVLGEFCLIVILAFVFALLLIGSSLLT